jgi:hypothetical protein
MKNLNIMLEDELLTPLSDPVPRGRQKQFPISGKVRPLNMLRASLLLAVTALLSLFGTEARSQSLITVTCDFGVPDTGIIVINPNPVNGAPMATVDAGSSAGGLDSFLCSINMLYSTAGGIPEGDQTRHHVVASPPDINPVFTSSPVPTSLTLTGCVKFPDPNIDTDFISLTLTGLVGTGAQLVITKIIFAADYALPQLTIN